MIGKRIPQIESYSKATGSAKYSIDMKFPGMLYGKILRSPYAHAKIKNISIKKALELYGVKCVVTGRDLKTTKYGAQINDEYVLAKDKVRYIGDEVAAVAAINENIAEKAIDMIDVEYEKLPAYMSTEESTRNDAIKIHKNKNNIATEISFVRGDIDKGFDEADIIIEKSFKTSNTHAGYLEPQICIAKKAETGESGSMIMYGSFQAAARNRDIIAKILGISKDEVRLKQCVSGGGFGGKSTQVLPLYPITAILAIKTNRPVRLSYNWHEEFNSSRLRMKMEISFKLGLRSNGLFTAKEMKIVADSGAYAGTGPAVMSTSATRATSLYRYKNVKCNAKLVYTNTTPIGSVRGYGNPQMHFAQESMIDIAAEKLKLDPAEIRLKNAIRENDTSVHGWKMNSCKLKECITTAMKKSQWKNKNKKEPDIGYGMASMIHVSGNRSVYPHFDGSSAYVKINSNGNIDIISGEADIGQGSGTVFAMIVSEILKTPIDKIKSILVDTAKSPFGLGTFASRVTTLGGQAVKLAAIDAKNHLLITASKKLNVNKDRLELSTGRVRLKGNKEKNFTIKDLAEIYMNSNGGLPILGVGNYQVPEHVIYPKEDKYGNISVAYSFGVQVAKVRVNKETGKVTIIDFLSVHDSGKIINPLLAEGQVEGGVVQGIGYALYENIVRQNGRVINDNFTDYKFLTISDVPNIKVVFEDSFNNDGPFGAKSIGEICTVGCAAAIGNAIYDAIGVRLYEVPFTPEKVIKEIRNKKEMDNKAV